MKKYFTLVTGILMASAFLSPLLVSCTDGKGDAPKLIRRSEPIPVRILEIELMEQTTSFQTSGRITTDHETILAFKTGGVVEKIYVDEGEAIRKGQVLAAIDLREINAIVEQAKLGFEKSQRDFNRAEKLYGDSVITLEQLQNTKTALDIAKEQLETAGFNRQFSRIVAPHNGFVLKKFVNPGQVVAIGDPILMTNDASDNAWILEVNTSDRQWSAIRVNDKAKVKIDAYPEEEFEATVLRKSETSDPATGTFTVDLLVKNGKATFASGMFGAAEITTGQKANGWPVPYEAVLDANGNEGFVFVTADYKTAIKQLVTISSMDQNKVVITSGFEKYKALIVSGSAYLTDKSEITILNRVNP